MIIISEFGLKIKNIEASTLFEYNIGVRDHYEYKDAMFTNSLFNDYLLENGLKVWKEESTRDVVCLEFNYGSRSYEQEIEHLRKIATNARNEYRVAKASGDKYLKEVIYNKKKKISDLLETARLNRNKYQRLSVDEIREKYYQEGVDIEYITRSRSGDIKKREVIHYKMLFRSTGKAKKGSCMFICDKLYKKALNWLRMGIKLPDEKAQVVEISAYSPLSASGIVDRIKINPENILILKDVDRFFTTNVVSVETDKNKHCIAKRIDNYQLKNTLFDGQAIIDADKFPADASGYILLRHHFFKAAAFCGKLQQFFKDYFGDKYETAKVTDMFGVDHYIKDIEMVTTDNAIKWLKFNVSYQYWCDWVHKNDCNFGIVKTAHPSKLGKYQKMSYQMVNSLSMDIMGDVVKDSVEYLERLKSDDIFFLNYLRNRSNFSNDYEALVALCEANPDFIRSSYFRERKKDIIKTYVLNMKNGELIQNADNLTVIGSPYAMMLYAATGNQDDVDLDDTFSFEKGTIQCYTERFSDGEYLAFFRSPFNSKNNLSYLHNVYHEKLQKYFIFGPNIIAINMNGTDAQDRNNGMDMDSDFGYTTNHPAIVEHARRCYLEYPTIVNNIPKDTNVYKNTMLDFARIDNGLAASQLDIGESSNLAQIAQSYSCNFSDSKFDDYVCILSILAQVAIDNAKRRFDINLSEEIRRIKLDMDITTNKYPAFWGYIKKGFNKKNINKNLICPMNYLCEIKLNKIRNPSPTLQMDYFFNKYTLEKDRRTSKKVEDFIEKYSLLLNEYNSSANDDNKYLLLRSNFNSLIEDIRKIYISKTYLGLFSWLLDRAFVISTEGKKHRTTAKTTIMKNRSLLIKVLYVINSDNLIECFSRNI